MESQEMSLRESQTGNRNPFAAGANVAGAVNQGAIRNPQSAIRNS
jgi:hypothetical protein